MCEKKIFKPFIAIAFLILFTESYSQSIYTITTSQTNQQCEKGAAGVNVTGSLPTDNVSVTWSTGQSGIFSINGLDAGDYSAHIIIKNKKDSTVLDSTVAYNIGKEDCIVSISRHFTPNGDGYNDYWQIENTHYYPKFEVYVFNKWGQQVHSEKHSYTPWDGKWNGINAADGTYYYVFYYDGGDKSKLLKGDVTILR